MLVTGGINVERRDVATLDIFGIIFGMIAADAAPDVVVPGYALSHVQQNGARRIVLLAPLVVLDDLCRRNGRTITFLAANALRVVGFVTVHPGDDRRIVFVGEAGRILRADDAHA